jgi:putative DNA primase/helicase
MIRDLLADRGIVLRHHEPGQHRAPCPWCDKGPRDDALAVRIDADGACWHCHRCGEKGALRQAQDCNALRPRRRTPAPEPERHDTLSPWGLNLWDTCRPVEPGTFAAAYLDARCCAVPPGDLRWHPELPYHVKDQKAPIHVGPALVALVTDIETGEPISLHRTWITATGKADLGEHKARKLLWNHRSDGVIRLWPDAEVATGLVIGEGIETCLAAARAGLTPCWSAISAGNLASFPVLPGLDGITVLVDHDKPNPKTGRRAGHEAALALVKRYVAAGFDPNRDIVVLLPSGEGLDVADLVGNAS